MSLSDPIADMLTRIRNASRAGHPKVSFAGSNLKESIVSILKNEGFIANYLSLPGCISQGKTKKEASKNVKEAIRGYLKFLRNIIKLLLLKQ